MIVNTHADYSYRTTTKENRYIRLKFPQHFPPNSPCTAYQNWARHKSIPVDTTDAAVANKKNDDGNLGLGHQWVFP